jgi:hypothetical protein
VRHDDGLVPKPWKGVSLSARIRLWHVTLTVAGDQMEPLIVRQALTRLAHQRPFLHSLRFAGERAEVQYWEEADDLLDASSLALRVWNEHRDSAGLPRWEVVGLEVLERPVFLSREPDHHTVVDMHDVTPMPF